MLKFLRKYSKVLLVVFGAFLMVAFLAPQAIQQLGQFSDRKVGTIGGEVVMASDLQRAESELQLLAQVTPILTGFVSQSGRDDAMHWLLLTREAEQGGFYGGDGDGQAFVPEIVDSIVQTRLRELGLQPSQVPPDELDEFRQNTRERVLQGVEQGAATIQTLERPGSPIEFDGPADPRKKAFVVLAKARGVFRMVTAYERSARLSTQRLRDEVRAQQDAATFDVLTLNARSFIEAVETPTEEELQAHFQAYKDVPQGGGEFGVGYRLDRAVTLEWIEIDAPAIREVITVDPIEARTFYEKNRTTFAGEYADERERVAEAMRARTLEEVVTEIDKVIKDAVIRARRGVPQAGDFYDLPEDWADRRPDFSEIADRVVDRVRERFGFEMPRPAIERRASEFLPRSGLRLLPGIGQSVLRVGSTGVSFADAVFLAREFDANPDLGIQAGLTVTAFPARTQDPGRPGQGLNGPLYYFRILETRDARAPTEITDDIRNRVIADERAIRAYQLLTAEKETFRSTLAVSDFDTLVGVLPPYTGSAPEPLRGVYVSTLRPFPQYSWPTPALNRQDVRSSLLEQAYRLDPLRSLDEQAADLRAVAESSAADLSVVVGRVESLIPLTSDRFVAAQGRLSRDVRASEMAAAAERAPFGFEALAARHNYRSMESDDAKDEDDAG